MSKKTRLRKWKRHKKSLKKNMSDLNNQTANDQSESKLLNLPDELLLKIFGFFKNAEFRNVLPTCKRFNTLKSTVIDEINKSIRTVYMVGAPIFMTHYEFDDVDPLVSFLKVSNYDIYMSYRNVTQIVKIFSDINLARNFASQIYEALPDDDDKIYKIPPAIFSVLLEDQIGKSFESMTVNKDDLIPVKGDIIATVKNTHYLGALYFKTYKKEIAEQSWKSQCSLL